MTTNGFFDKQTGLTAAKIKIFEKYIQGYLPKLLIQFNECIIADLFCGAGKNGSEPGSPLVLIESCKYILSSPIIQRETVSINIIFNDSDVENITNLKDELSKISSSDNIIIEEPLSVKFEELLPSIIERFKDNGLPKFFFLDPFTYSNIKMDDLKQLMSLDFTEVLLFIPIFHSYRFASDETLPEEHKTRLFINEFTTKGVADYDGIEDFMNSVKLKLSDKLSLKYIRPVLLDDGSKKNSLFLLTKHQKGMLLMNKIALEVSEDGSTVKVKDLGQKSLFGPSTTSKFEAFESKLIEILRSKKLTNGDVVEFAIVEEYLPKNAKQIISTLYDECKIFVEDETGTEIKSKTQWNIAEEINKTVYFSWKGIK